MYFASARAVQTGGGRLPEIIPSGAEESRRGGLKVALRDSSTALRYAQNDTLNVRDTL